MLKINVRYTTKIYFLFYFLVEHVQFKVVGKADGAGKADVAGSESSGPVFVFDNFCTVIGARKMRRLRDSSFWKIEFDGSGLSHKETVQ